MAKKQKPAWVYLLAGLIIGLFVAFLLFLSRQQPAAPVDINQSIEQALNKKDNQAAAAKKPELGFYDMLPKLEVSISPELEVRFGNKAKAKDDKQTPSYQPSHNAPTSEQKTTAANTARPAPAPAAKEKPQVPTKRSNILYLQVGSYSQFSGADKQKATLILSNWPAKIQRVALKDGRQVYRVFVGPYNNQNIASAQQKLKQLGLKPILHHVKS